MYRFIETAQIGQERNHTQMLPGGIAAIREIGHRAKPIFTEFQPQIQPTNI